MLHMGARLRTSMVPRMGRTAAARSFSTTSGGGITRLNTENPNMSQTVIHSDTVYLAGQVPNDYSAGIKQQTEETLAKVDALLEEAGTDKSQILQAQIWVKDMEYFADMNEVWASWLDPHNKPVRACVAAPMAHPDILVEVMVVAAKLKRIWPDGAATGAGKSLPLRGKRLTTGEVP